MEELNTQPFTLPAFPIHYFTIFIPVANTHKLHPDYSHLFFYSQLTVIPNQ